MTEVQELLIRVIGNQLFAANEKLPEVNDWHSLFVEAQQQAVFSIVYSSVRDNIPSGEEKDGAKLIDFSNKGSAIRNLYYHNELHKLLSAHSIPYVVLKGQASAYYYPEPMLRTMGDVDFLINSSDIDFVDRLLTEQGYKKAHDTEKHSFHWLYKQDEESLEMHWSVPGLPENSDTIQNYLSDIIEKRIIIENSRGVFAIPSEFHHGLVLLLHTISHLTASGIGLRHLCDWLVFENRMTENDFISTFEKPLKEVGLWTFAKVMTKTGIMYFGCKDRGWCRDIAGSVCTDFINDIFDSGNFGAKDKTRKSQAKLIRNETTKKVGNRSILTNALVSLNEKAKRDFPIMSKRSYLLPLCWGFVGVQYVFRVITGERSNVFDKAVFTDAMNRKKLYSELKLFETSK